MSHMNRRNFIKKSILGLGALFTTKIILADDYVPALITHESVISKRQLLKLYDEEFISQETLMDIKNWVVDQIDEVTRKEIYACIDETS